NDNLFQVGGIGTTLNGGAGNDTASFAGAGSPVTIDLRTVPYVSIERIIGSQFGGDIFIGDANDNFFDGNVNIYANPGPTLYDTPSYQYATGGITINQIQGSTPTYIAMGGGQGTDTLVRIEKIIGSDYDDTFNFTQDFPTWVDARGGNDTVSLQSATTG